MIGNAIQHLAGPQPEAPVFTTGDEAQHRYQYADAGVGIVVSVRTIDNPKPTRHSLPAYQRIEVMYPSAREIRSLEGPAWQFIKIA